MIFMFGVYPFSNYHDRLQVKSQLSTLRGLVLWGVAYCKGRHGLAATACGAARSNGLPRPRGPAAPKPRTRSPRHICDAR